MLYNDHPVQRRAVAEAVGKRFGGDAVQRQEAVVADLRFVFGEAHLFDAPAERHLRRFDLLERVLRLLFVVDVDDGQARAGRGKGAEVGREGDARQLALEIGLVAFAVGGAVSESECERWGGVRGKGSSLRQAGLPTRASGCA